MADDQKHREALEEAFHGFRQFTAALAMAVMEVKSQIRQWVAAHPHVFHPDNIKRWQEIQRWAENLPQGLADSLGNSGVVFHPELTLPDLFKVEQAFRSGGEQAAQNTMLQLQSEFFTDPSARARLEARWNASRRCPVLRDILAAHDAGLYGSSVPAALAQAEGIVAEGMRHRGRMKLDDFERLLHQAFAEDELSLPLLKRFRAKLMSPFQHGDQPPHFSRHAILHGGDWTYGSHENSVRALVWLDSLLCVFHLDADELSDSTTSA